MKAKLQYATKIKPFWHTLAWTSMALVLNTQAYANEKTQTLSLEKSIQIGIAQTPEMKAAIAQIGMQQGKITQATTWANPNVSLQADNLLGIEDTSGGYNFTEIAVSQAIPMFRAAKQQQQAELGVAKAEAMLQLQQLQLEYRIAQAFYDLQRKQASLRLSKSRLFEIKQHQRTKASKNDPLVRYLTPLEVMRLDIALQTAQQQVAQAEGLFHESSLSFKALLGLPLEQVLIVPVLKSIAMPYKRSTIDTALEQHPSLQANRQAIAEAEAGIAVAKAERFADPVVTLFVRNEFLAGQKDTVTGLVVSMDVPLWNQNKGGVSQAQYRTQLHQADLQATQRDLQANVDKSFLHVSHLTEQSNHYQAKVLKPAKKMLRLTHQAFDVGELSVLNLIDAYNTSFDAQDTYIQMLASAWQELALLRFNAGISVIGYSQATPQLEKTQ